MQNVDDILCAFTQDRIGQKISLVICLRHRILNIPLNKLKNFLLDNYYLPYILQRNLI